MLLMLLEESAGVRHEAGFQGSGSGRIFWSVISWGPGDGVLGNRKGARNSQQTIEQDADINVKVLI